MAFDFYFAGATTERIRNYLIGLNANVLKSYYMDKSVIEKFFDAKKNGWRGKLMIDNDEFSFHRHGGSIDIDEYIAWINKNDEYIDYAIAVDSIPGKWRQPRTLYDFKLSAQKTWDNYIYMLDKVKSPQKLLPVFHQGDGFDALRRFLMLPDLKYICVAGSKDLTNADREVFYEKCFDIIVIFIKQHVVFGKFRARSPEIHVLICCVRENKTIESDVCVMKRWFYFFLQRFVKLNLGVLESL